MIKLNNFHKLLFLIFLSSCTVPVVEEKKENIATEKVSDESYFTKTFVILSDLEDYEIQLSTLESFTISESLGDYEISHKNLPYPGVALNCVANGKILEEKIFDNIWIQPAAGDAGGSLGAALALWHIDQGNKRSVNLKDDMKGSYLGTDFSQDEIENELKNIGAPIFFNSFSISS